MPVPFLRRCQHLGRDGEQCPRVVSGNKKSSTGCHQEPTGRPHNDAAPPHPLWSILDDSDHPLWHLQPSHPLLNPALPLWQLPADSPLWTCPLQKLKQLGSWHQEWQLAHVTMAQMALDLEGMGQQLHAAQSSISELQESLDTTKQSLHAALQGPSPNEFDGSGQPESSIDSGAGGAGGAGAGAGAPLTDMQQVQALSQQVAELRTQLSQQRKLRERAEADRRQSDIEAAKLRLELRAALLLQQKAASGGSSGAGSRAGGCGAGSSGPGNSFAATPVGSPSAAAAVLQAHLGLAPETPAGPDHPLPGQALFMVHHWHCCVLTCMCLFPCLTTEHLTADAYAHKQLLSDDA